MRQEKRTAIVTGASSGIGYAVCRQLAERGYAVYGLSRRGTAPEGVRGIGVDITSREAVFSAVNSVLAETGRIDLLVNDAGMGISGPVEFASEEDIRRITEVNFLGQVYCTQAVLETMRSRKNGRIVFVSSVAAGISIPYQAFYSATKSAVNALALALRNELKDFNIKVCAVMPGDASTGFTAARKKESLHDDIYTHNETATAAMEKDELGGMTPDRVASVIVDAAEKKDPKPLYVAGGKYKLFMGLFKILPAGLSYRIVGKMYA